MGYNYRADQPLSGIELGKANKALNEMRPDQGEEGWGGIGSRMRHGPRFVGGFRVWGRCLWLADHVCLRSRDVE